MIEHAEFTVEEGDTQKTELPPNLGLRDRASLVAINGHEAGRVFSLSGEVLVGRAMQCQLRIDEPGVSRVHAKVVANGRQCILSDLNSRNGVFVNGQRVTTAELHHGDRVNFGPSSVMRFALADEQEERLARELYRSAVRDALTGVFNRGHFEERIAAELAYAMRHHTEVALAMLDIDHFKRINDRLGHPAGDQVLREVAGAIARSVRAEDLVARYGGEEFVVMARGINIDGASAMAERIRSRVGALSVHWETTPIPVTLSAGVALFSECGGDRTGRRLVELADSRLYAAKTAGRNRVIAC
ncbi:MAG: GGDEF domain-containing protein [Deltaproteobacteria bacterium]|nr:GGDEF domain-containing protein [Deltaproteobacteria bacterium]